MYELWFLLHIYLDCLCLWKIVLVTWKLMNWYCRSFHMLGLCLLLESCWIKLLWSFKLSWDELIIQNMCFPCFLKICAWIYVSMILIVLHLKHILHKTWFMRIMNIFYLSFCSYISCCDLMIMVQKFLKDYCWVWLFVF